MNKRLFMLRNRNTNGPKVDADTGSIITFDNKMSAKAARDEAGIDPKSGTYRWKVSPGPDHRLYTVSEES